MKPVQYGMWLLAGGLISLSQGLLHPSPPGTRRASAEVRLLGPAAELGRSIQWIRFQRALLRGDQARALMLADSALELDPSSTESWLLLTSHLGYFLASPEREPALQRRRRWLESALAVSMRGTQHAKHPRELHMQRAMMLFSKLDIDPEIDAGGASSLRAKGLAALRDAAAAGSPSARELLESLGD